MARKKKPLTVTLAQIESHSPCGGQYRAFLKDMKVNPVPEGAYGGLIRPRKDEAYGPDDPIPLSVILETRSSGMPPHERVVWLMERFFPNEYAKMDERAAEIRGAAYEQAMKEALG